MNPSWEPRKCCCHSNIKRWTKEPLGTAAEPTPSSVWRLIKLDLSEVERANFQTHQPRDAPEPMTTRHRPSRPGCQSLTSGVACGRGRGCVVLTAGTRPPWRPWWYKSTCPCWYCRVMHAHCTCTLQGGKGTEVTTGLRDYYYHRFFLKHIILSGLDLIGNTDENESI